MNTLAILLDSIKRRIEVEIANSYEYKRTGDMHNELVKAMEALTEDLRKWAEMAKESEE